MIVRTLIAFALSSSLSLALLSGDDVSASPAGVLWERSVGSPGQESPSAFAVLPSGDLILAGLSYAGPGGDKLAPHLGEADGWIVRTDARGVPKWDATFGGTQYDDITGIVVTHDERLLCVGYSGSPAGPRKTAPLIGGLDLWVVCLDANGTHLWDRTFGDVRWDVALGVCLDQGEGYFIAGETGETFGITEGWLLHLGRDGDLLWERRLNQVERITAVSSNSSGDVFLGGYTKYTEPDGSGRKFWAAKINSADGSPVWEFTTGEDTTSLCRTACATRDGNVIVAGEIEDSRSQDRRLGLILKLNNGGQVVWRREVHTQLAQTRINSVVETADGGVFATGAAGSLFGETLQLVRLGPDGELIWRQSVLFGTEGWNFQAVQATDGGWLVLSQALGESPDRETPSWGSSGDFWLLRLAPESIAAQADPPILSTWPRLRSYLGRDGFHFSLIGKAGQTYVVEHTRDLSSWTPFSTNIASTLDVKLVDLSATNANPTFYRAREIVP